MAIFLSFICGATLFYFSIYFPYACLTLSIFLLLLFLLRRCNSISSKLTYLAIVIIFCSGGYLYAKLLYSPPTNPLELQGSHIELKGILKSEKLSSRNSSFFLQNIDVIEAYDNGGNRLFLKELHAINESGLEMDKIYLIKGRFPCDGYYLNPGSKKTPSAIYIHSAVEIGIYKPNFFEKARVRLNSFIIESFSVRASAFLLSIVTGERNFLAAETKNAFNITGLAHILSISGTHFGLLFIILFTCFKTASKYLPYKILARLSNYVTSSQIAAVMTAPFLIFYLGISSLSIPSIRAFTMITFFLIGLLAGRKGFWLNTLAMAAFIIVVISPDSVIDLSFQLSFLAVLCIGLIAERLRDKDIQDEIPEKQFKKSFLFSAVSAVFSYLKYSSLITLAATAGTAPLVAYYFHYFSLVSPLTNLLLTPLIGFIILPAALLSSLTYLASGVFPFASILDNFTILILDIIEEIATWRYIDIKIPAFPPALLFTFYSGLLLFTLAEHRRLQSPKKINKFLYVSSVCMAVMPFIIYAIVKFHEPNSLKITFLDVGQGDAAVVELADNSILVIDTGKSGYQVGEFLKYRGARNIDVLAISHSHADHAGGIEYLLSNFNVSEVWGGGEELVINLPEKRFNYRKLQRGDVIEGTGYKIHILHPYDEFYTRTARDDENNYSMVMKIFGSKNSFLFTGDIAREAQEDLANLKSHLKSNVLKVPHHGSKSSADEIFYELVSPEIAVISAGRKNILGHPHENTLRILNMAMILRTDIEGAVGLQEMPDGTLQTKTFREFQFVKAHNLADEVFNIKKLLSVW